MGYQMLGLVMNILDVQRFEESAYQLKTKSHWLAELTQQAGEQVISLMQEKNIRFTSAINKQSVVEVDAGLIIRVLVNLLTNAIKFTPLNGQVSIFLDDYTQQGFLKVAVQDNGIGILKEEQENVFEKYNQGKQQIESGITSTGLGLSFCKLAVEAHGGAIGVESEHEKGATFWFTIPIAKNTPISSQIEMVDTTETSQVAYEFGIEEVDLLSPIITEIKACEIYEISIIEEALSVLANHSSKQIQAWKADVEKASYALNAQELNRLLTLVNV